jgi:hypothetical protein
MSGASANIGDKSCDNFSTGGGDLAFMSGSTLVSLGYDSAKLDNSYGYDYSSSYPSLTPAKVASGITQLATLIASRL